MAGGRVVDNDIYALAAGFYPILPARNLGTSNTSVMNDFKYSADYRNTRGHSPSLFSYGTGEGAPTHKAYLQGNYLYYSFMNSDFNPDTLGNIEPSEFDSFVSQFRNSVTGQSSQLMNEAATTMNVGIQGNYIEQPISLNPSAPIPPSLEETGTDLSSGDYTPGGGMGLGASQQFDFIDNVTGRGVNVTKTGLGRDTTGSHGMYGNLQRELSAKVDEIDMMLDEGVLTQDEADLHKAERGRQYFETRLGDWNNYIRHAKANVGMAPGQSYGDNRSWSHRYSDIRDSITYTPTGNAASDLMQVSRSGQQSLNRTNTGFMTEGAKTMMKQLFSSPDIAFGAGGEERFPIGPRTFVAIHPFQIDPTTFLYRRNILEAHVMYGRMSTMPERNAATLSARHGAEARAKMISFTNATHHSDAFVGVYGASNSIRFASHTTPTLRLMPELDLQTVGPAWTDAINRLLGGVGAATEQAAQTTPMRNLLDSFTDTWSFMTGQGNWVRDAWSAPYIGILSESEMISSVSGS